MPYTIKATTAKTTHIETGSNLSVTTIFKKVKTLAVFGSILTDRFNDQSDVDLLVDFDTTDHENWDYVTNYFDFRDALERLSEGKLIW